jgi:hypothetical protein
VKVYPLTTLGGHVTGTDSPHRPPGAAVTITPGDPRYHNLVTGYNNRFIGSPHYVRLVHTTDQVVEAVAEAVAAGRRIAVRSGGHCFEDFTHGPQVEALLDLSPMSGVHYDPAMRAFCVGAGTTLGQLYPALFKNWGVTIPGGTCLEVGVGGHITGGGYGPLSRRDGLVVDHLYAVEVVVVDADGYCRVVTATREADDPNRDLWWAMTGGGGGNFGVVTRFWLRSAGVDSTDPARLLPAAPGDVRRRDLMWSWDTMTEERLSRLIDNYCRWLAANDDPNSPTASLWSNLIVTHRSSGMFGLTSVIDDAVPGAERILDEQVEALLAGTEVTPTVDDRQVQPWFHGWLPSYNWPSDPRGRYKNKAGYLRRWFTDRQLAAIWRHLSDPDYVNPAAGLVLTAFGGAVNRVASDATAAAQRDCVLKVSYSAGAWQSPADDERHTAWVREFYRDVYADTGGVPVPNEVNDGSYISYPDVDLADPAWNTSGVPWHTLYYKDNYPRLQQIKLRYDPRDVFRHRLSVRLPR